MRAQVTHIAYGLANRTQKALRNPKSEETLDFFILQKNLRVWERSFEVGDRDAIDVGGTSITFDNASRN